MRRSGRTHCRQGSIGSHGAHGAPAIRRGAAAGQSCRRKLPVRIECGCTCPCAISSTDRASRRAWTVGHLMGSLLSPGAKAEPSRCSRGRTKVAQPGPTTGRRAVAAHDDSRFRAPTRPFPAQACWGAHGNVTPQPNSNPFNPPECLACSRELGAFSLIRALVQAQH